MSDWTRFVGRLVGLIAPTAIALIAHFALGYDSLMTLMIFTASIAVMIYLEGGE